MAKKRRRKSARRHARTKIVYRNRPAKRHRRRRTHYRRNSPAGIVRQVMNLGIGGAIGAVAILVGEGSARLVASDLFGKDPGSLAGGAIQVGTGLVEGLALEMLLGRGRHGEIGRQAAKDVVSGVLASIGRTTLKQLNVPIITRALSDEGNMRIIRPLSPGGPGQRRLNGYVRPRLNGYVRQGDALNGINERIEQQLGYRA